MRGHLIGLIIIAGLAGATPLAANDISNGSWSTTDGSNNATPPNGWPAGMFPNQVEPSARAMMGAIARFWERINPSLNTAGGAAVYTLATSNASYPTAYTNGEEWCMRASHAADGSDTLQINALAAKTIWKRDSAGTASQIGANDIAFHEKFCVSYDAALDGGSGAFELLTALPGSSTVAASQSDAETATSTSVYIAPGIAKYSPSSAKAFIEFSWNGATISNIKSYRVASVSRTTTGTYSITLNDNFSHGMPLCNAYATATPLVCSGVSDITGSGPSFTVKTVATATGTSIDVDHAIVAVYGDLN
jgi:hypothetical protein